jgi:hypothetical protein
MCVDFCLTAVQCCRIGSEAVCFSLLVLGMKLRKVAAMTAISHTY